MRPADYSEWLDLAGLYLENVSHADRYRTFERKVSAEGLNVRIVQDFLRDNRERIDVASWRNYSVYELDGGLPYRIQRTAEALAAIGAAGAAQAVRTSQNTTLLAQFTSQMLGQGKLPAASEMPSRGDLQTMMQELRSSLSAAMGGGGELVVDPDTQELVPAPRPRVESRDELVNLLAAYAEAHGQTLQADIDRYGDVRQAPGFDAEQRRRELEATQRSEWDREEQIETVGKMRSLMEQVETRLAKFGDHSSKKMRSLRRDLLEARREYVGRPHDDLVPEMRAWLAEFETFADRYANVFFPPPVENPSLLARLQDLGDYEFDVQEWGAVLSWSAPRGFDCDWPRVKLSIQYPHANEEALAETLDVVDELRAGFAPVAQRLRAEALSGFHDFALSVGGLDRLSEWIEISRDEDGGVSEAEILRMAGDATLNVESMHQYGEGVTVVAWFPAEWDEEHGLEVPLVGQSGFGDDDDDEGDDAF